MIDFNRISYPLKRWPNSKADFAGFEEFSEVTLSKKNCCFEPISENLIVYKKKRSAFKR